MDYLKKDMLNNGVDSDTMPMITVYGRAAHTVRSVRTRDVDGNRLNIVIQIDECDVLIIPCFKQIIR